MDSMRHSEETRVTVSQIAELAAVQPSAVSNWRKRFEDFPEPVGTVAGGREVFSLVDVETWLLAHDRLSPGRHPTSVLWRVVDRVRNFLSSDEIVEVVCSSITFLDLLDRPGSPRPTRWIPDLLPGEIHVAEEESGVPDLLEPLTRIPEGALVQVMELLTDVSPVDRASLFETVLEKQSRFTASRTGAALTRLLVRLSIDEQTKSVLDPAAGEGGFLLAASRASNEPLVLNGQEINGGAWRIATQRFLIHGIEVDLRLGDSLSDDAFANQAADVVLCDPPYGLHLTDKHVAPDSRWMFGVPTQRSADYLWLQHAISHLAEEGRGCVLMPAGSLYRRGREEQIRKEMVRLGVVETVIALPAGSAQHTSIPLALWLLKRPAEANPAPVLLVDAVGEAPPDKRRGLDDELTDRIVGVVMRWRASSQIAQEDADVATQVSVLDLLGAGVNLVPVRWVRREAEVDPEEREDAIAKALNRFDRAKHALQETRFASSPVIADVSTRWVSIRELTAGDIAQVIKGVRIPPEDCLSEGTRAIRTRDFKHGSISDADPCYVDVKALPGKVALTERGDIIVSPGSGNPKAVVDDVGGHVLVSPLQGLRLRKQWLDPYVAAAFLTSPRNRRFVKGTTYGYARIDLRDLELPVLPLQEAQRIRSVLDDLVHAEELASELADATKRLRETLVDVGTYRDVKGDSRVAEIKQGKQA